MSEIIKRGSWWQKPHLRTDEEEDRERKVTWLELFYDLVFVVVIAQLAHALAGHVSASGVLGFVLLFVPVWWVWIAGTFYKERFETTDVSNRLFTFLQMLPVAAMAVFAPTPSTRRRWGSRSRTRRRGCDRADAGLHGAGRGVALELAAGALARADGLRRSGVVPDGGDVELIHPQIRACRLQFLSQLQRKF